MPADPPQRSVRGSPVLIIDDDRAAGEIIARYFAANGLSCRVEGNSFAGVNAARRMRPAVAVVDIDMPGLDGIAATRLIRRASPQTRVILVSGYPDAVMEANRHARQAHAVLQKPLPLPALLDFVRRAL
ncbi:MAG: response regulator [Pseudomonadota bacterium]|nr:response regulator [Pseudomonadota bacterium]